MPQPKSKTRKVRKRTSGNRFGHLTIQEVVENGGSIRFVPKQGTDHDERNARLANSLNALDRETDWLESARLRPYPDGVEPKKEFASGATRSGNLDERYDLMSPEANRRRALTYGHGARVHGVRNWEKGMPVSECLNRAIRHINKYLSGDTSEDHLGHASVNLDFAMHFEEHNPECVDCGPFVYKPQRRDP